MPVPGGAYIHPDALAEPERRRVAATNGTAEPAGEVVGKAEHTEVKV